MNGVHDLGGNHGFGPIEREPNEPAFHADWEKAVLVMNLVGMVKRIYNIDEFRHAIERMGQARYLDTSYYEHWLASVETLMVEKGVIGQDELDARTKHFERNPDAPLPDRKNPELLAAVMNVVRKGMAEKSEPDAGAALQAGRRRRDAQLAAARSHATAGLRARAPWAHPRLPRRLHSSGRARARAGPLPRAALQRRLRLRRAVGRRG